MKNSFSISDGKLCVDQIPLLEDVPENIIIHAFPSTHLDSSAIPPELFRRVTSQSHKGGFIGFIKPENSHRHTNSLGRFNGRKFISIFRFQSWWSTTWIGSSGSDLQKETMWVLMDLPEKNSYVTIIPIISGSFRSAIHPGDNSNIIICAESGSTQVQSKLFNSILYVHVGTNAYKLIKESFTSLRVHLNTFRLLEEKALPRIFDKFGWCTWDGFHQSVNPIGIWHGVRNFSDQGIPLRFLMIDDGWQSVDFDMFESPNNCLFGRTRMQGRLYSFEECNKFMGYREGSLLRESIPCFDIEKHKVLVSKLLDQALKSGSTDELLLESKIEDLRNELDEMVKEEEYRDKEFSNPGLLVGLKAFIQDLRTKFRSLDDVYVWQALCGYWGGIRPGATKLDTKLVPAKSPPGLDQTMIDSASVNLVKGCIGLVDPDQVKEFYDLMHSHLAKVGVTGVKMDVINSLEFMSEGYGGQVELAKIYYQGLTQSIMKNFNGTGAISSMQQ